VSLPAARLIAGPQLLVDDYPVDLAWSPDGKSIVVAGGEGHLHHVQRDAASPVLLGTQEPGLLSVVWQPGGKLVATAGQDGSVRLWDALATAGSEPAVLHRGMQWPAGLGFEPRGKALAFAVGKTVQVVGLDGVLRESIAGHDCPLTLLAWRNSSELIAAGNGALFVDHLAPAGSVAKHALDGGPLTLAISPDGRVVANGLQDGQVMYRNLVQQKKSRMSGYDGKVTQTSWSANSRYLATAATGGNTVIVWDFSGKGPEGTDPLELKSHADRIDALAYQPEGPYLVSGGRDWRVVLWRPGPAARREPAAAQCDVQLLDGPVSLVRWSRDGRQLAVAQASGKLRFYTLQAS
jgi:WD40 repeat protein